MRTIIESLLIAIVPSATAIVVVSLLAGRGALGGVVTRPRLGTPADSVPRLALGLRLAALWCRLRFAVLPPRNRRRTPGLDRLAWHSNLRRVA